MRDCVFFVADKTMQETFLGFLTREDRFEQLECGAFEFDPNQDLFFAAGQNDPGLFTRAGELLKPFTNTHRKLVVVLDCDWDASPGQTVIIQQISEQLAASGWEDNQFIVIAIDPELEQWIWQDSPILADELRHLGPVSLRSSLQARGLWPEGLLKPPTPKELFNQLRQENRVKKSSSIYKRIATAVPVAACQDNEFKRLVAQLQAWFPMEVGA